MSAQAIMILMRMKAVKTNYVINEVILQETINVFVNYNRVYTNVAV